MEQRKRPAQAQILIVFLLVITILMQLIQLTETLTKDDNSQLKSFVTHPFVIISRMKNITARLIIISIKY